MLSPKSKRRYLQIIPFGIISMVFSILYSLIEKGILGDHPIYPSTGNPYHFSLFATALFAFIFGLIIGSIEVLYLSKKFQKSSFIYKIVFKGFIYFLLTTVFTILVAGLANAFELKLPPWNEIVLNNSMNFIKSFAFWSVELFVSSGILLCLFYIEVSDNIGQGTLLNFLMGKYHHPIEEDRIFMFLDMKSSTTIAEKLGHEKYFTMLKEYYSDLTDSIINHGGEIYQYVGDEVVITWKEQKDGKNTRCIDCFFDMRSSLHKKEKNYEYRFGAIPTFKAGIHLGNVTTGEIGVMKKEIIFSGDVLNTAARIQGLCNQFKTDFLASEDFISSCAMNSNYKVDRIGETILRGKDQKMTLFTVRTE